LLPPAGKGTKALFLRSGIGEKEGEGDNVEVQVTFKALHRVANVDPAQKDTTSR